MDPCPSNGSSCLACSLNTGWFDAPEVYLLAQSGSFNCLASAILFFFLVSVHCKGNYITFHLYFYKPFVSMGLYFPWLY